MDRDRRLRERLDRLAGPVDRQGVWADIEARVAESDESSAEAGLRTSGTAGSRRVGSRRARLAVCAAAALLVVVGVAVGTSLGTDDGLVVYGMDDGREGHWENLSVVQQGGDVWSLSMDPADSATLYATTRDGIYKTTDGAASWASILALGRGWYSLVQISPSPTTLIAIVLPWSSITSDGLISQRLMRSDDGGANWTDITENLFSAVEDEYPGSELGSLGVPYYDQARYPGAVFLSVQPPVQGPSPFWRSTDRGTTWTRLDQKDNDEFLAAQSLVTPSEMGLDGPRMLEDANGEVLGSLRFVVNDPDDPSLVYGGTNVGVCRSTDGGDSWTDASSGIEHAVAGKPVIDPEDPSVLYMEAQEGVFKSVDAGATWESILPSGYLDELGNNMCSLVLSPSRSSILYAWTSDGLSRSDDGGQTWAARRGEDLLGVNTNDMSRSLVAVAPDDSDIVFAQVFTGTGSDLLRSVDGGDTWTTVLENVGHDGLHPDPNNPGTLYVSQAVEGLGNLCSVAKSVDKGATWETVLQGDDRVASFGIAVGTGDPAPVYTFQDLTPYLATIDEEGGPKTEGVDLAELEVSISRSPDGGASWDEVEFTGLPGPIAQLVCDPRSTDLWYALSTEYSAEDGYTDRSIYRSSDGGFTWVTAFDSTPPGCHGLAFGAGPDAALYAYGSLGIYRWVPAD